MREYEPKLASRHVGSLIALLKFDFGTDLIAGLEAFDRAKSLYESAAEETLSDKVLVGAILLNLPDSNFCNENNCND